MNKLNDLKKLIESILITVILLLLVCGVSYITGSFTGLFVLLLLFIIVTFVLIYFQVEGINSTDRGVCNIPKYVSTLMTILLLFGFAAILCIKGYINPNEKEVLNIQHNALRVDGITLDYADGFLLAKSSNEAFLDNSFLTGAVTIDALEADSVVLRLQGVTRPIFGHSINSTRRIVKRALLNSANLIQFERGDSIEFTSNGGVTATFVIDEYHCVSSHKTKDTATYAISVNRREIETSATRRFLQSGLNLQSLLSGVVVDSIDLSGINIIRPTQFPVMKQKELYENLGGKYAIDLAAQQEVGAPTSIKSIKANGKIYYIKDLLSSENRIKVPYDAIFSIGFAQESTHAVKFRKEERGVTLLFDMPRYNYLTQLGEQRENTIRFASTLIEPNSGEVRIAENNLLFNFFTHYDNVNSIKPGYLSFVTGASNEDLICSLHYSEYLPSISELHSGDLFPNIKSRNHDNRKWIMSVENFRKTSPLTPRHIAILLISTVVLALISLRVGSGRNFKTYLCSHVELVVSLILIAFVTIRLYLLWRVMVFPPLTSVSPFEFYTLHNLSHTFVINRTILGVPIAITHFGLLALSIGALYGAVIVTKCILIRKINVASKREESRDAYYDEEFDNSPVPKKWGKVDTVATIVSLILIQVITAALAFATNNRFTNILIPIVVYLVVDIVINLLFTKNYEQINAKEDSDELRKMRNKPFILSLFNLVCTMGILLVSDGGYGIMFAAYSMVWIVVKLMDINHNSPNRKFVWIAPFVLVVLLFIIFYNKILLSLVMAPLGSVLIFTGIGSAILVILIAASLSIIKKFKDLTNWRILLPLLAIVAVICCAVGYFKVAETKGTHIEYRAKVLLLPYEDILSTLSMDDDSENKFLQASVNDWVLKEYNKYAGEVDGTFSLRPHSKVGAMWFAQTTDISLARFITGEHGKWLPFFFVITYLFLFLSVLRFNSVTRWGNSLVKQVSLLLLIQVFFIWLVNSRRFIFFGQDFPLVSISSTMTVVYFFVLMLLILLSIVVDSFRCYMQRGSIDNDLYEKIDHQGNVTFRFLGSGVFIMLLVIMLVSKAGNSHNDTDRGYNIEALLNETATTLDRINEGYINYQAIRKDKKDPVVHKTDMSVEMNRFVKEYDVYSLVDTTSVNGQFAKNLLEKYIKKGSHNNTPDALLHIRKNKDGELLFAIKSQYYNMHLPSEDYNSWRGDIIEVTTAKEKSERITNTAYTFYNLPARWFASNKEVAIIRSNGNNVSIDASGNSQPVQMEKSGLLAVMTIDELDDIKLNNSESITNLPFAQRNYIAQNVLVNGQRSFGYPLQENFYWARRFAGHVSTSYKGTDLLDQHCEVTLNANLTTKLCDVLDSYRNDSVTKNIIVADGDGHIRAMVDYKVGEKLDPNNDKRVAAIYNDLYMNGGLGGAAERLYFANNNLIPLPSGPGSSQKPLTWAAVMSGFDISNIKGASWQNLRMDKLISSEPTIVNNGGNFELYRFNGAVFNRAFRSIASDEGGGNKSVDLDSYIYKSSNYYNAMMAYIGSFPATDFKSKEFLEIAKLPKKEETPNEYTLFRSIKKRPSDKFTREEYEANFPVMTLDKKGETFVSFNKRIQADGLDNTILHTQLKTNFGLDYALNPDVSMLSLYPSIPQKAVSNYVYPEQSILNLKERTQNKQSYSLFVDDAVRYTAIGGSRIWHVTPLMMAEMYGRLISFNKEYRLTLDPNQQIAKSDFNYVEDYSKKEYLEHMKHLIAGMQKVFSPDRNVGGTARNARPSNLPKGFQIYGKTGTINDSSKTSDHLLAVVITNKEIEQVGIDGDFKFYVLYISQFESKDDTRMPAHKELIETVIDSECFKQYMGIQ